MHFRLILPLGLGLGLSLAACNESGKSGTTGKSARAGAGGSLALNTPTLAPNSGVTRLRVFLLQSGNCAQYPVHDTTLTWQSHPVWKALEDATFPAFFSQHQAWFTSNTGTFFTPPTTVCVISYNDVALADAPNVNLNSLASGNYALIYSLEDDASNPKQSGISSVTVNGNNESSVNIVLTSESFPQSAGAGSIQVSFPGSNQSQLAFTNFPLNLGIGACGLLTIAPEKSDNSVMAVTADLTVGLTASTANGAFYSDVACSAPITSSIISNGGALLQVYFKDSVAEAVTLTATAAGGLMAPGSQNEGIGGVAPLPAPAAPVGSPSNGKYTFTNTPLTQAAGACGALIVQAPAGNAAPTNVTFSLSSNSAKGAFFSDAGCSLAINSIAYAFPQTTIYYKDAEMGYPMVSVTPSDGSAAIIQSAIISVGTPTRVAFYNLPATIIVNVCTPVSVQIQDAGGNFVAPGNETAVSFKSSSTTGRFFSDPGCIDGISGENIGVGAGDLTVYYRDSTPGMMTFSVSGTSQNNALTGAQQAITQQ